MSRLYKYEIGGRNESKEQQKTFLKMEKELQNKMDLHRLH